MIRRNFARNLPQLRRFGSRRQARLDLGPARPVPAVQDTFTVLPVWSPPYGHYSYECRRQACEAKAEGSPPPHCHDATRLPDDCTVQRWAWCRFISLLVWLTWWSRLMPVNLFSTSTILAWDFPAARRILRLEANSP
jgi:hypothetical protein